MNLRDHNAIEANIENSSNEHRPHPARPQWIRTALETRYSDGNILRNLCWSLGHFAYHKIDLNERGGLKDRAVFAEVVGEGGAMISQALTRSSSYNH